MHGLNKSSHAIEDSILHCMTCVYCTRVDQNWEYYKESLQNKCIIASSLQSISILYTCAAEIEMDLGTSMYAWSNSVVDV